MTKHSTYNGVVVPMITPVTKEGFIDEEAIARIIGSFKKNGISTLLMGTTGEGNSIPHNQALVFVKKAVEAAEKKITIYAGLSGCCLQEHIETANAYCRLGADVIVATLPAYYMLTGEQMHLYYKTLADNIEAPLMLYNIKATTHMSIPVDVIKKLSEHPNIVGLKDSERDLDRIHACIDIANENFAYFSGWAAQSAYSLLQGADGIVPSTGNFVPEMFKELYEAAIRKDEATANRLQKETDSIATIYQKDRTLGESLAALKVMMGTKELCSPYMLSPLTRLSPEHEKDIVQKTKQL